jgi:hypothetical protein
MNLPFLNSFMVPNNKIRKLLYYIIIIIMIYKHYKLSTYNKILLKKIDLSSNLSYKMSIV